MKNLVSTFKKLDEKKQRDVIAAIIAGLIIVIFVSIAIALSIADNSYSDDYSIEEYSTSEIESENSSSYNYNPFGTQYEVGEEKERKNKMRDDIDKYRDHFNGNISDEELKEYLVICDGYEYSEVKEELQRQEYEGYWNNRY